VRIYQQDRENSKKPVMVYQFRDEFKIDIPTWENIKICSNDSFNSTHSNDSNDSNDIDDYGTAGTAGTGFSYCIKKVDETEDSSNHSVCIKEVKEKPAPAVPSIEKPSHSAGKCGMGYLKKPAPEAQKPVPQPKSTAKNVKNSTETNLPISLHFLGRSFMNFIVLR